MTSSLNLSWNSPEGWFGMWRSIKRRATATRICQAVCKGHFYALSHLISLGGLPWVELSRSSFDTWARCRAGKRRSQPVPLAKASGRISFKALLLLAPGSPALALPANSTPVTPFSPPLKCKPPADKVCATRSQRLNASPPGPADWSIWIRCPCCLEQATSFSQESSV